MTSGMFLIQNDGSLIEMGEQAYTSEDHLQELLATYPNLLAGNQIDEANPIQSQYGHMEKFRSNSYTWNHLLIRKINATN